MYRGSEAYDLPMNHDEVVSDVATLLRAVREGGAGLVKISKVGGLTKAKLMRDLAQGSDSKTTEDTWGGDIVSATSAHVAASTERAAIGRVIHERLDQRAYCRTSTEKPEWFQWRTQGPGLGIDVDASLLGAPLISGSE